MQGPPAQMMGMVAPQAQQPLLQLPQVNIAEFDTIADPSEKRQYVGNNIYGPIEAAFSDSLAGKITGMLLDESVVDFRQLLTNPVYLTQKAKEAYTLLMTSAQQTPPQ